MKDNPPRRTGGRAARRASRAAPLDDAVRPVRPGMECDALKVLSQADILKIHNAALQVLEEIGLADAPQSGIDHLTRAGAIHGADGRIRFPRALVEDLSLIHISEPTRLGMISYAVFCLKKKKKH